MPAEYEKMRDKFMREGLSSKAAKSKAAAIYTSRHPSNPASSWPETKKANAKARKSRSKRMRRRLGWAGTTGKKS